MPRLVTFDGEGVYRHEPKELSSPLPERKGSEESPTKKEARSVWIAKVGARPELWVVLFGLIGGILSCFYTVYTHIDAELEALQCFLASLLGAGAAYIGVFLLANSDVASVGGLRRTLAFALVCGFSWSPIYDAGTALVNQRITEGHVVELSKQMETLLPQTASDPELVVDKMTRLLDESYRAGTNKARAKAAAKARQTAETLDKVAESAILQKDAATAEKSVRALVRLKEKSPELAPSIEMSLKKIQLRAEQKNMPHVSRTVTEKP